MHKSFALAVALISTLPAACSQAESTPANPASPSPAAVTPTAAIPSPPPATPQQSCAQPMDARDIRFLDGTTGLPIVIGPDERIVGYQPPYVSPIDALVWIIRKVHFPFSRRVVYPRIAVIVGESAKHRHNEATLELLPSGTLAEDFIRHLKFTADRANAARAAAATSRPLPSPLPADASAENEYVTHEQSRVAANLLGTPFDDSAFQDDDGDPNASERHDYIFACKFVESVPYTLILRVLFREPDSNTTAYRRVQTRLDTERAPDDAKNNVGYVAKKYVVFVARGIKPALVPHIFTKDDKPLMQRYAFDFVACMIVDAKASCDSTPEL